MKCKTLGVLRMCMWNTCMCASDTFVSPCTYHIYKNNYLLYIIDCVSNYISRKMSVSHDIIMIEYNSKLPIRVLFCCFLCSLLNRFRLSCLPYAFYFAFLRTVFPMVSDSLIVFPHKLHSAFRLDRKTCERSHVFRLTGTAASHCGHTF